MHRCSINCSACINISAEVESIFQVKQYAMDLNLKNITGLDIGAHVGLYGVLLNNLVNKMHSFEIVPSIYKILKENSKIYPTIVPYNIAAWNKDEILNIVSPLNHPAGSWVTQHISSESTVKIPAKILDNLFLNEQINFFKLDVEGAEVKVLEGMQKILNKNSPMIAVIEYAPEHLLKFDNTIDELYNILRKFKFEITNKPYALENLVCIKK